jgi:hypothetical protein
MQALIIGLGRTYFTDLHYLITTKENFLRESAFIPKLKKSKIDAYMVWSKPVIDTDQLHPLIEMFDVIHVIKDFKIKN